MRRSQSGDSTDGARKGAPDETGNGISDLDNAGLQGLYLHIVDKGSDEDSKLWMKGKASRGGESRCE